VPVDLHLHSTVSDGSVEPARIVDLAAEAGLSALALTDHDTLEGIGPAAGRAAERGIDFIAGTELSVRWRDSSAIHMLVYFLEPGPGPLQDRLGWLQHARATRNERIVARLQELGIDITAEDVAAEARTGVTGRPHFAALLVAKGYVPDISAAFDRYLAAGRPGYLPRERLEIGEAIGLAIDSGALAVIAHPHTIGVPVDGYRSAFAELRELGLVGVEAHYGEYTPELRAHLAELCGDLGLVATGGSDFHGDYKPSLRVGIGKGDLSVPEKAVFELKERLHTS
jgi:predicted metal-dependent phosphoesterase TrpH